MGKEKSIRDVSRKTDQYREHMRTADYEVTPAQRVMRQEMEAGLHKQHLRRDAKHIDEVVDQVKRAEAKIIGELFDETFGTVAHVSKEITELAYAIINGEEKLTLSFRQWGIVQRMIEEGIRQGYALGSEGAAHDRG